MKKRFIDCIDIVGESCKSFEGTKQYISTGAVQNGEIDKSQVEIVDYATKPSRANVQVKSGDVLFAKMQATVKVLPINEILAENIYSTGFFAIRAKKEILNSRCLTHILKSESFNCAKDKECKGATQKALNNDGLANISINIPDENQERIADELDQIEAAITALNRKYKLYDELVKARFVEMFGDPETNPNGYIKAPMGEYMTLLTDFSSNGSYKTLDSGVTMYDEPNYAWMVRTTDLESGDMTSIKYIDEAAYELLAKSKIFGGEIIMNKIGSAGKVYLMPEITMPASLGRNAFMFRYDERINVKYLYHLLISEYGQREIQQYVRGAVTKTITKNDARSVMVVVPPIELQEKYVDFVAQIDKSKFVESLHLAKRKNRQYNRIGFLEVNTWDM